MKVSLTLDRSPAVVFRGVLTTELISAAEAKRLKSLTSEELVELVANTIGVDRFHVSGLVTVSITEFNDHSDKGNCSAVAYIRFVLFDATSSHVSNEKVNLMS